MAERVEKDGLGEVRLNEDAYYGINTARAIDNFRVSGIRVPTGIVRAAAIIKSCYAKANMESSLLDGKKAEAIIAAAGRITEENSTIRSPGRFPDGSGTSTKHERDEVVAAQSRRVPLWKKGRQKRCPSQRRREHGQSSNDVFPTAIQLALLLSFRDELSPSLEKLMASLESRSIRSGRSSKQGGPT